MSQDTWWAFGVLLFAAIATISIVLALILRTYSRKVATGKEDLKGSIAVVREKLDPEGVVFVDGGLWNAVSQSGKIEAGQEVIIIEVNGLTLTVKNKT
jgi:membrane-bound serine protease (ClpP class)